MTKAEELKAKLASINEAAIAAVKENLEIIDLTKQVAIAEVKLARQSDPKFIQAKTQASIAQETADAIQTIESKCQVIIESMPIFSKKTRENRKWNPSNYYGLGSHIGGIYRILTGILYSTTDHKVQLLAETGLYEDLVESTILAFGNTAYYSETHKVIVPAVPYNIDTLVSNLTLIADILNINPDMQAVTETTLAKIFQSAESKAEADQTQDKTQGDKTVAVHNELINI